MSSFSFDHPSSFAKVSDVHSNFSFCGLPRLHVLFEHLPDFILLELSVFHQYFCFIFNVFELSETIG